MVKIDDANPDYILTDKFIRNAQTNCVFVDWIFDTKSID